MNGLLLSVNRVYRLLLHLLPGGFLQVFGEEMYAVFSENAHAAYRLGLPVFVRTCLCEFTGLLKLLFHERMLDLRRSFEMNAGPTLGCASRHAMNVTSSDVTSSERPWVFSRSRSIWIAVLPPVILGFGGAAAVLLAALTGSLYLFVAIWAAGVLAVILGSVAALIKGLPDWGWTWLGSALMLVAFALKLLAEELAETGGHILSPAGDLVLMGSILLAGFILLLTAARRGWQHAGLVSIGFTAVFGEVNLMLLSCAPFNRMGLAVLAFPAGLIFALLILLTIRGSSRGQISLLAAAWLLNAGIFCLQNTVWQGWLAEHGCVSPFLPLLVFSTGIVLAGPLVGVLRRPLLRLLG